MWVADAVRAYPEFCRQPYHRLGQHVRGRVRISELARNASGVSSAGTLAGINTNYLLGLLEHPPEISSTLTLAGRWKLALADKINGELELQREQGDLTGRGLR